MNAAGERMLERAERFMELDFQNRITMVNTLRDSIGPDDFARQMRALGTAVLVNERRKVDTQQRRPGGSPLILRDIAHEGSGHGGRGPAAPNDADYQAVLQASGATDVERRYSRGVALPGSW